MMDLNSFLKVGAAVTTGHVQPLLRAQQPDTETLPCAKCLSELAVWRIRAAYTSPNSVQLTIQHAAR
jgi:hypothetical protein